MASSHAGRVRTLIGCFNVGLAAMLYEIFWNAEDQALKRFEDFCLILCERRIGCLNRLARLRAGRQDF